MSMVSDNAGLEPEDPAEGAVDNRRRKGGLSRRSTHDRELDVEDGGEGGSRGVDVVVPSSSVCVVPSSSLSSSSSSSLSGVVVYETAAPSRRNKRKMTEPKRRTTDFSIRSLCSNKDADDDEDGESDLEEGCGDRSCGSSTEKTKRSEEDRKSEDCELMSPTRTEVCRTLSSSSPFLSVYSSYLPSFLCQRPYGVISSTVPTPLTPIPFISDCNALSSSAANHRHETGSNNISTARFSPSPTSGQEDCPSTEGTQTLPVVHGRRPRKNYKNMTKQRRIEANARERTRVHTISAAFESLRRAVPSYSYNQRLSKLAILRIACSYILALARLAELDYSHEQNAMTFGDCVDLCTQTIQAEGKAKRRH